MLNNQIKQEYKRGPVSFLMNVITISTVVCMLIFTVGNSLVFKKPFEEMGKKLDTFMDAQASQHGAISDSLKVNTYVHNEVIKQLNVLTIEQQKIDGAIIKIIRKPIE